MEQNLEPNRLKSLRLERGYTQIKMQMLTGIEQSNYSKLETGTRYYSFEQCRLIALALGTSMDYLAGLTDVKEPYPRKKKKPEPGRGTFVPVGLFCGAPSAHRGAQGKEMIHRVGKARAALAGGDIGRQVGQVFGKRLDVGHRAGQREIGEHGLVVGGIAEKEHAVPGFLLPACSVRYRPSPCSPCHNRRTRRSRGWN